MNHNAFAANNDILQVTVKSAQLEYLQYEPFVITYTITNNSNMPVIFFDQGFIFAERNHKTSCRLFPKEMFWRNDWRASLKDYVTINPAEAILHTFTYDSGCLHGGTPTFPMTIAIQFVFNRTKDDNFYYNFENEGILAKQKIHIDAWTGRLVSDPLIVNIKNRSGSDNLFQ